jgi:hypothetical protein
VSGAGGAPVEPGAEEARRLAREELAERAYVEASPGLAQRVWDAVVEQLGALLASAGPGPASTAAVVVVLLGVALLVVLALRLVGRPSLHRAAPADPGALLDGGPRTAAEHRAAADAAATGGRWDEAVRERFRAVVVALAGRDLVPSPAATPGLTAAEAAAAGGRALPARAGDLAAAATLFDAVAYGGRRATPADDAALRELDTAVAATRPDPRGLPVAAASGAG